MAEFDDQDEYREAIERDHDAEINRFRTEADEALKDLTAALLRLEKATNALGSNAVYDVEIAETQAQILIPQITSALMINLVALGGLIPKPEA